MEKPFFIEKKGFSEDLTKNKVNYDNTINEKHFRTGQSTDSGV